MRGSHLQDAKAILLTRGRKAMKCASVHDIDRAFLYILEWRGTYVVNFMLNTFEINKEGSLRDEAKELAEKCLHTHKDSMRSRYISELFNIDYAEDVEVVEVECIQEVLLSICEWGNVLQVDFMLSTFEIDKESLREEAEKIAERCWHRKDRHRLNHIMSLFDIDWTKVESYVTRGSVIE
jgi:hypothetical protein